LSWLAFSFRRFHKQNATQNISATPTAAPTLAPIAVKFVVEPVAELGAMVCIDDGSGGVVDVAIGRGAEVGAELGPDPVVDAGGVVTASTEETEVIFVDVELLVDDSCALDMVLVGRIQNCRLQNPHLTSALMSPKASTALIAKGASQSGSQVMVQSSVLPE
jgi:hypothetical protein